MPQTLYSETWQKLEVLSNLIKEYNCEISMDSVSSVKLKLYNQRIQNLKPNNIASLVKERSSFYGIYMLNNKNEKSKCLLRHLQKQIKNEFTSTAALRANVDQIFEIEKQKERLIEQIS